MSEKTPEQLAAEQAAAAKQAEKAAAKAKKDAEAAAKKAAKEAAAAEKQAKADAKKAEKEAAAAKKEAEKQAKIDAKAAKAAEKEAAKAAKQANRMPEQNGVRRPGPDGLCGQVWALADKLSTELKQAVPIANLLEAGTAAGLNASNIRTEYARWKKFHGLSGRITLPTPVAQPAA